MKKKWSGILFVDKIFRPDAFFSIIEVSYYTLFLNISFFQYTQIISLSMIISTFLEIPSGIISDFLGRKKILILGTALEIFCMIGLILYGKNGFKVVLIISILKIIGSTLASGNFDVLIYENAESVNEGTILKEKSADYFSKGTIISSISGLFSTIFFSFCQILPLVLDLIIKIIKITSYFFLDRDRRIINNHPIKRNEPSNFSQRFLSLLKNNKNIIIIILLFSTMFILSRGSFGLYQPIFTSEDIPIEYFGIFILLVNINGYLINKYILKRIEIDNLTKVCSYILLVLFLQIGIISVLVINKVSIKFILLLLLFSAMQLIRLFSEGLASIYINTYIENKKNKTLIFSIYQTIVSLGLSITFFFLGFIQNVSSSYIISYLSLIVLGIVTFFIFRIIVRRITNE